MMVDSPTSTGPVEVFVVLSTGASVVAGAVGDTSLTGTPPEPVATGWGVNSETYVADSVSDEPVG